MITTYTKLRNRHFTHIKVLNGSDILYIVKFAYCLFKATLQIKIWITCSGAKLFWHHHRSNLFQAMDENCACSHLNRTGDFTFTSTQKTHVLSTGLVLTISCTKFNRSAFWNPVWTCNDFNSKPFYTHTQNVQDVKHIDDNYDGFFSRDCAPNTQTMTVRLHCCTCM